ncbi:hypothetical protein DRE_04688 [Drechslerella stenobrocha 248]|uniref:Uncharacterized protein n=1 Tax=Drechslerella stenobrocha 248 TaxID=1043628 RepID=W7HSC5_9PEZI|nr:hypothetical protein DRE_04688 [Drechslerella stenobrocha 248]
MSSPPPSDRLATPFLLHALSSLTPAPAFFKTRARRTVLSQLPEPVASDLRLLSALAPLLATNCKDAPSNDRDASETDGAALTMRVTATSVHFFYARGRPSSLSEHEYIHNLLGIVHRTASGQITRRRARHELIQLVCSACSCSILARLRRLADAACAMQQQQSPGTQSTDPDTDIAQKTAKYLASFHRLSAQSTWRDLARCAVLARAIVHVLPSVGVPGDLGACARDAAQYLDIVEMILRRATASSTRIQAVNAVATDVYMASFSGADKPPQHWGVPSPSPPSATVLQILNCMEEEHYGAAMITAELLTQTWPHLAHDQPWTYDPRLQRRKVHAEAAVGAFMARNNTKLKLPYLVLAVASRVGSCWACDVYLEEVVRGWGLRLGCAGEVYSVGCHGRVPDGEDWAVPGGAGGGGDIGEEFCGAVEEAVEKIVRRLRVLTRQAADVSPD